MSLRSTYSLSRAILTVLFTGMVTSVISPLEHTPNDDDDDFAYAISDSCITYNSKSRLISVACKSARLSDIDGQLNNSGILANEERHNSDSKSNDDKVWILRAGITIEQNATLIVDSNDTTWLKIVPVPTKQLKKNNNESAKIVGELYIPKNESSTTNQVEIAEENDQNVYTVSKNNGDNPNGIHVFGSLIIDSVKITSWDPEENEVIKFHKGKRHGEEHTKSEYDTAEPRPFIRISAQATGTTNITNSEIAYLGYSCSRCSGLSYYGGIDSLLKENDIHHLLKGYYSNGMGHMVIEDNRFYDNYLYGIDPHTGTHDLIIRDNIVHDNNASGIICSKDCYGLLIEGNKVFDNGGVGRGIAFSINTSHSVARNNEVYDQNRCIAFNRESNFNDVYNNKVSRCTTAISLSNTSDNQVHDNDIAHSENGITMKDINNRIYNNSIQETENAVVYLNSSINGIGRHPNPNFFDKVIKENDIIDVDKEVDVRN